MSRFYSYLNSAITIIDSYDGSVPFSVKLRQFFINNKKYGSRDRKEIASICYAYFRAGRIFLNDTTGDKIVKSVFLCSTQPGNLLATIKPEWNEQVQLPAVEKLSIISDQISLNNIFPWKEELTAGIDYEEFCRSFLVQPDLFLRVRPGMRKTVSEKLKAGNIDFTLIGENCIVLPNGTKIEELVQLNKEAVVQDYNSQRIGELLRLTLDNSKSPAFVWDCCAASGGKSIMAKDILGDIDLTVSDVRESILINLKKRFSLAGIKNYRSLVADLKMPVKDLAGKKFDLIIADVPCSGSGTWSRTPEQLCYFEEKKIEEYAELQKKIISNLTTHLQPDGYLLYITCSVFSKENDEAIAFLKEKFHLELIRMELLKGYFNKADTMFAALLKKN